MQTTIWWLPVGRGWSVGEGKGSPMYGDERCFDLQCNIQMTYRKIAHLKHI